MEGQPAELVGVLNILFHQHQPGHMLFQGPGYHHWISEDFGKTYAAIETPGKTLGYGSQLKLHPTQPDWVLARVRRNECLKVSRRELPEAASRSGGPWTAEDNTGSCW